MKKKTLIISIIAIIVIGLIWFEAARNKSGTYQFVTVTRGAITEEVDVTGNTTPVESLDLAFQNGGTIAAVYKNAGDSVNPGDPLARLDTSDLQAQLAQAQASVDAAQATLENLQAGSTPQSIQVSETALASAEQSLANEYASISDTVAAALSKANDAVRNQLGPLYTNPEGNNPQLTFSVSNSQVLNNAEFERLQASQELNAWQAELNGLTPISSTSTLTAALNNSSNHLAVIETLLETVSTALVDTTSLSASTLATYQTDVADAVTEVENAAGSISGTSQSIASDQIAVAQAQAQLNVTLAGSTPQAIAAQQAAVAQAQANAQSAQVKINEATLISPIAGVVTVQNAKVGQIAPAGQTVTSIISDNNFEIDSYVPETDIGKIAINDPVTMTFDAFPGETFNGKVFYIDPAETIESGVVDYLVKVSFNTPDPRIKSGLTANLTIAAQTDMNALIVPQYAVIQNASGTFVEVLQNGAPVQIPVVLGIRDQEGNVEVASGVSEGQQVVNIGLKTP
jgi:HlyD family secretion protein